MAYAFQNVVATANAVGTTETSVAATPAVPYSPTGNYGGMNVYGNLNITNGTALTLVVRVRNGSGTAGTTIGSPMTVTTVSGNLYNLPFQAIDTSASPATQYNVTLTGGAGVSTVVTNSLTMVTDPILF